MTDTSELQYSRSGIFAYRARHLVGREPCSLNVSGGVARYSSLCKRVCD